jgi:hypothetical protein
MDRDEQDKRQGNEARNSDKVICPQCGAEGRFANTIMDPQDGKNYRLFYCECGKIIWDK